MSDDFFEVRVDLDREATEEHKQLAREIFATEKVGIRGRYASEVTTIVEVASTLALGAGGSALWEFVKWGAPRVKNYVQNKLFDNSAVAIATYRAESAGLLWEIRHRSDQHLGEYEAGIIITGVDTWQLPEDAARISINLVEKRVAVFDSTGLHIEDIDWPDSSN